MKCTACGAEVKKDSKFCTSCGKPVEEMKKEETSTAATQPAQVVETPKKKSNKTLWIVLGIVGGVILLFIILAVVLFALFVGRVRGTIEDTIDEVEKYEPTINDKDDGKVYKTITAPSGKKIKIINDSSYIKKVDTTYYYDEQEKLEDKVSVKSEKEIEKLSGTEKEIDATKKAVEFVERYPRYSAKELSEKLVGEGFTQAEADYAVKNAGIDWKEMALIYAHSYMAAGGFSKKEVAEMLVFSGFTEEEAEYGANYKTFDFYEQVAYDVVFFKYTSPKYGSTYSREDAERMLKYDEYTDKEVEFGMKLFDELD